MDKKAKEMQEKKRKAEEEKKRVANDKPASDAIEDNPIERKQREIVDEKGKKEKPQETHFLLSVTGIFNTRKSGEKRKDQQGKKSFEKMTSPG